MPDSIIIAQFERRLVEMGCPARCVADYVMELAEHYDDLKQAALEEGLPDNEASARASARLGDPVTLAENAVTILRQSSWWGRHPIIAFCLLPLPAFILGWTIIWACLAGASWLLGTLFGPAYTLDNQSIKALADAPRVFNSFATPLNWLVTVATTLLVIGVFYKFAHRTAVGMKWLLALCVVCAALDVFSYSELLPHSLVYGLCWHSPLSFAALAPLLVGLTLFISQHRKENRLVEIPASRRKRAAQQLQPKTRPAFYGVPTYWVMMILTLVALVSTIAQFKAHSYRYTRTAQLRSDIWPTERAATLALIKKQQSVTPSANEQTIDLKPYLNAKLTDQMPSSFPKIKGNNLSALPAGVHTFGGVTFDVEGCIQLADLPSLSSKLKLPLHVEIPIARKCSQISLLHGAVFMRAPGMKVALFILHYKDGLHATMEITGGKQVLDWWGPIYDTNSGIGRYTTSPDTELAWAGSNPGIEKNAPDFSLRLYRTTFINPHPELEISSIDYVSGLSDGVPFLVGLTIQEP